LFQIEVDAVPPDVLQGLLFEALDDYWDADAFEEVMRREHAERGMLEKLAGQVPVEVSRGRSRCGDATARQIAEASDRRPDR
jgi:hypothetical protein